MNRKTGSIELLDIENSTFNKPIPLDGYRSDSKSNLLNKQDSVSD